MYVYLQLNFYSWIQSFSVGFKKRRKFIGQEEKLLLSFGVNLVGSFLQCKESRFDNTYIKRNWSFHIFAQKKWGRILHKKQKKCITITNYYTAVSQYLLAEYKQ